MTDDTTPNEDLEQSVRDFLDAGMPQIEEHGGKFQIERADAESGVVELTLGGACGTCIIAPMTREAIEEEAPNRIDGVEEVHVKQADRGDGTRTIPTMTETMREEMGEHYDGYDGPSPAEHF